MSKILYIPDPRLRQKSKELKKVTLEEVDISNKMIKIMIDAPGVGLAANQIGILKKIITVNIKDNKKNKDKIYALFNPKIIFYSKEKIIMEEGCLSLPQQYADIERPENIVVEYLNKKNEKIKEKKNGYEARILQHEIDHLNGKLFIDYISSLKRNIFIKRVKKLQKIGEI